MTETSAKTAQPSKSGATEAQKATTDPQGKTKAAAVPRLKPKAKVIPPSYRRSLPRTRVAPKQAQRWQAAALKAKRRWLGYTLHDF
ncbi:MAG: hypothetical protein HC858_04540 [Brachymonas sp.]|nr:hypothetical protein [Brachymonas sp.]